MLFRYKKKSKQNKPLPLFDKAGVTVKKKIDLKAKLDRVFSMYIRLRDSREFDFKAFRCISCGRILPFEKADNGHYINRQHMSTRFDEMNCNAQCSHCNRFQEGNMQGYRNGLIRKYGEQKVVRLEMKKNTIRKFSDFEYEQLIKYYSALVKQMKQGKFEMTDEKDKIKIGDDDFYLDNLKIK